jgi:thioredoxin-like negative regulator of GroEL
MAMAMDVEEIFRQGFQLRCEGRYPEARAALQQVLAAQPSHVNAAHQLGLVQGFEGDFEGSLVTLQAISTTHPSNLEVRYDLAMTQLMLGMFEEGCSNLKYILSVDPTHEKALQQSVYC